ncbi:MAG: hypothetical protein COY66_00105 [Candidatus Kerfeldbacteria bacterium CG_4_10_14_0_8_um_filter_42_10]|uniref:Type II secretion system protein GspF domain-containing protein n=1 Tax=Candidatus Kerfeldbacteria bacterium CG_4_10_14_0_8_um_filter_42_10 TaxID=2014248 RepID=A0A2M7RLN2_9BACT|nr:MAG: hypothetical protein COY66_00105 [Candidatus Kerfeldbacteria bacterium CG_4_10_14_0_8_um_filter_42_10]
MEKKNKEQSSKNKLSFMKRHARITLVNKLFFTQQLEVMARTGFSLSRALETISLQMENRRFKQIIENMKAIVEKGSPLSKAASEYPKVFSETFVSMVAAGESSGKLDEALKRLTIQLKKSHEIRTKIKNALTYPAIVLIAMVAIGIAMLIFVLPKITAIYEESGTKLPLPTRVLIGTSDFIIANGIYISILIIVLIIALLRYVKTPRGKKLFHKILLVLPIVGPIIRKINLANFSRSLSSLLQTDIPIVETFKIISRTSSNIYYKEYLANAAEELKKGVSVKNILEKDRTLFPPLITQIINIGEESGTLDTISEEIANFYEEEVSQTMANLATIIEPVLMLILGVGVGAIAVAVVMPMYSLVNTI